MPNEQEICSEFSKSSLVHPADHYAPLRTDPSPVDLEGNERIAGSYVSLKRQEPALKGGGALSIAITQSSLPGH